MTQTSMNFKKNIHPNSLEAYKEDILPELTNREQEVYDAIKELKKTTCRDVAIHLHTFPHAISGRFTGLKKKGYIKEVGTKKINGRSHALVECC